MPLLLPLLFLLLLLLLALAALWGRQAPGPRPPWLASLQHRAACGALCWAAAWQQWRLEQSTLHAGQRQQQALGRCLKAAQAPRAALRGSTGVFPGDPKRKNPPPPEQSDSKSCSPPSTPSCSPHGEADPETLSGLRMVRGDFSHPAPRQLLPPPRPGPSPFLKGLPSLV